MANKMSDLLININQRYKSSTRIDVDTSDLKPFIDDFIVHGTAVNVIDTISREFQSSTQRAYTITGPYGSGKSTIALFLSCLLSQHSNERDYAQAKLDNSQSIITDFNSRFNIKNGWQTIKHVCGLEAPSNSILVSLLKAYSVEFDEEVISSYDDEACLKEIKKLLATPNTDKDGVIILLDEMGKALDYQSRSNKDLHLFQSLADIVQNSKSPVVIIGFLHQAFSDYAKNKDSKTQQEWAKVQGRYRDLSFNPSIDESLILVGDSIAKHAKVSNALTEQHKSLVNVVSESFVNQARNVNALLNTLPLDPVVSLLLGPVSRRRFSQNERSLFGFLASHEKLAFREFLETNYNQLNESLALYQPEAYWDYLHHNLHHLIVTSHDSKAWLEGCDAIHRASQKGAELHVAITKVIALLTIFGFHHHLHAKRAFISNYFVTRGYSKQDVDNAISDLENWTVIIYRQKHDALFVFQGSDIDINTLINERIEAISEGVDWTQVCDLPQNTLATAHYHETGTMRWASTKLVNKLDKNLVAALSNTPVTGETFLHFVLPTNTSVAKELKTSLTDDSYIAIGNVESFDSLKLEAIELIALNQIAKEESKINHDLIAKNELETRITQAKYKVAEELHRLFKDASWKYKGKKLANASLTVLASQIANIIFAKAPSVINELVNRSKPSGSANSAIRKLMNAMFEYGDEKDLGFDENSFPPEKGLYLSCLKSKGWHLETSEGYLFPNNWDKQAINNNPKMHTLWQDGVTFIKQHSKNQHVTLAALYDMWMKPPYGLTSGLCCIYGLALLKSLEGQVAFYDFDSTKQFVFIPELDEELVNKIYKYPHEAAVRYFEISEIQTHLLDNLAKATLGETQPNGAILNIAKHIVGIVHKLPSWVKKTSGDNFGEEHQQGLSKEARNFRNKVIGANDPFKLILDDLPTVFGFSKDDPSVEKLLATSLKRAIEELTAQHDILFNGFKQVITSMLGEDFNERLKERCIFVDKVAKRPNVKEFAKRIAAYIDNQEKPIAKTKFEFIINLTTGTPERNWTDKHLRNGFDELQNLCIQFRRIESFGNIQNKGTSKPLALMTLDDNGKHKEFGSFIKHGLTDDTQVLKAVSNIQSNLSDISKEKQLAALSKLLADLMDDVTEETIDD